MTTPSGIGQDAPCIRERWGERQVAPLYQAPITQTSVSEPLYGI